MSFVMKYFRNNIRKYNLGEQHFYWKSKFIKAKKPVNVLFTGFSGERGTIFK